MTVLARSSRKSSPRLKCGGLERRAQEGKLHISAFFVHFTACATHDGYGRAYPWHAPELGRPLHSRSSRLSRTDCVPSAPPLPRARSGWQWNPSVLEQRTGRLDRIGALAEREGKDIEVYEPYLAGTHDEKMFRVVKDRAQWFDIVMGRPSGADEYATDAEESRVPLHPAIRRALAMDLRSP